ncbi:MAG: hypothetical protein EBT71_07580, partial [Alphaproteobacteria bacterium]|nr:hypothetical protein [Alphaproteobacteria bacterium]
AAAALEAAIKAHDATLEPAREAQARLERLAGERDALQAMVLQNDDENHAPIVDSITVEAGYEVALGAALGDDLEVAANDKAAAHWGALGENGADAPLPDNVASLAQFVSGAPRLTRRLSQIGLVSQADGAELQKALKPGQRLVSLEGDLWRWDGYCAAADAPVESRADLLSLGRLQLAPMLQGLNSADDNSGLLDQARARLADLVKLRRVGGGADQPATLLAAFEAALDHADFEAAFAAATIWSSAGLDGLDSWLAAAQRRRDLDQAVNQLVAVFVRQAAGQS